MVYQLSKPILGLVENMSFLTCPNCGQQIFLWNLKEKKFLWNWEPLGYLPVDPEFSHHCDLGTIEDFESPYSKSLVDRLEKLI